MDSPHKINQSFIARTRNRQEINVFYRKGHSNQYMPSITVSKFLEANTTFTSAIYEQDDQNIESVWIGKTKLFHNIEMFFSIVMTDLTGPDGRDCGRLTLTVSSNESVTSEPFNYIL